MNKKKAIIIAVAVIAVIAIVLTSVLLALKNNDDDGQQASDATGTQFVNVSFQTNGGLPIKSIGVQKGGRLSELPTTTKNGYVFDGWYLDKECSVAFDIEQPIDNDITLYAKWEQEELPPPPITEWFDVVFDSNGGTILQKQEIESGKKASKPTAPIKSGYIFDGWWVNGYIRKWDFDKDTVTSNIILYAKWVEDSSCTYSRQNDIIYFGSYPQNKVADIALRKALDALVDVPTRDKSGEWTEYAYYSQGKRSSYMWYIDIEYDGEKYRGIYFLDYRSSNPQSVGATDKTYQDDNGYVPTTIYWFLYQPIKWRIVKEEDGKAMLLCDTAIDAQSFDFDGDYSNNYAESTIREWLNREFYFTAFNTAQKALIRTTLVNNSAQSTAYSTNDNACEDTRDRLFLLSYAEAKDYGKTVDMLKLKTSDYAISQGCFVDSEGYCFWRLRSPYDADTECASYVRANGVIRSRYEVYYSDFGIVPALWLNLAQ